MQVQEYWPEIIREYREFEKIAASENPELEQVWQAVSDLLDDQFVRTATEKGIQRRERLLKITPHENDDLEYRKTRVLAKWNGQLPYTYRVLVSRLNQLFGSNYDLNVLHNEYLLKIEINTFNWREFDIMIDDIRQMTPANMVIQSSLTQKIKGTFFMGSAILAGEEITVYPWMLGELSSKGKTYIAIGSNTGLDTTTVYPRKEVS